VEPYEDTVIWQVPFPSHVCFNAFVAH